MFTWKDKKGVLPLHGLISNRSRTTRKKNFFLNYIKKIFKLIKSSEFFSISRTNPWNTKFNCPRKKNLQSGPIIIYYAFYSNVSTQLASVLATQKDFCYVHDDTDSFFSFSSLVKFRSLAFFCFFFLLQKDFCTFCVLLFRFFLCFFYLWFFIYKKNILWIFYMI